MKDGQNKIDWPRFCVRFFFGALIGVVSIFILLVCFKNLWDQYGYYESTNYDIQEIKCKLYENKIFSPHGIPHEQFTRFCTKTFNLKTKSPIPLKDFITAVEFDDLGKEVLVDRLGRPLLVTLNEMDTRTRGSLCISCTIFSEPFRVFLISDSERAFVMHKTARSYPELFFMIVDANSTE